MQVGLILVRFSIRFPLSPVTGTAAVLRGKKKSFRLTLTAEKETALATEINCLAVATRAMPSHTDESDVRRLQNLCERGGAQTQTRSQVDRADWFPSPRINSCAMSAVHIYALPGVSRQSGIACPHSRRSREQCGVAADIVPSPWARGQNGEGLSTGERVG